MFPTTVDLFLIEDNKTGRFLIRTQNGQAIFGMLELATTYSSMMAVKNAEARIRGDYDVTYRKARLELLP